MTGGLRTWWLPPGMAPSGIPSHESAPSGPDEPPSSGNAETAAAGAASCETSGAHPAGEASHATAADPVSSGYTGGREGAPFQPERSIPPPAELRRVLYALKARKPRLAAVPVKRIIRALHETSLAWLDGSSDTVRKTTEAISEFTGTSVEMVHLSIRHEMESSLAPDLEAAIVNEIGFLDYLDGFAPNTLLGGRTFASGPSLTAGVVSSNIPALSHLTVMRSLLVKSPCAVKTSVSEPFFLPAYAETLYRVDPEVGGCVVALNFSRENRALTEILLEAADFLIVYGGPDAVRSLRKQTPPDTEAIFHGHKLGFGIISGEIAKSAGAAGPIGAIAAGMAYDTVLFDQEACLAPHVVFFEGDRQQAENLARLTALEIETLAVSLPPSRKPMSKKLLIRRELDALMMEDAAASSIFPAGTVENGVVTVQNTDTFLPSPLGRFLRIVPVENLEKAFRMLEPLRGLLQNAFIAAPEPLKTELASRLAALGVSRICEPGSMGTPTMMWHHDGFPCLARMLRFTDIETSISS